MGAEIVFFYLKERLIIGKDREGTLWVHLINVFGMAKAKAWQLHFFIFFNILSLFTSHQSLFLIIQIKKITTKQIFFIFLYQIFLLFHFFKKKKSYFFLSHQLILFFAMPKTFIKRTLYSFSHSSFTHCSQSVGYFVCVCVLKW
jgi:hypothetical protein